MNKKYTLTKGVLELGDKRLTGWLNASTDCQQKPSRMEIDTPIDGVGPFSISEVESFRRIFTWSCLFPVLSFVLAGIGGVLAGIMFDGLMMLILVICALVGVSAMASAKLGRKWFCVYMVQFNNNGQTVYVPFIKKSDYPVIDELNSELKKTRK